LTNATQKVPTTPEIVFGARGWDYPEWVGAFYPDDLPPEWRFGYYSNEFRAVLIPKDYFMAAEPTTVASWGDDADEVFEFFVEVPASASWEQVKDRMLALRGQARGVYLVHEANVTDNFGAFERLLEEVSSVAPVVVDWKGHWSDVELAVLQRCSAGCYWRITDDAELRCPAPLALVTIGGERAADLKQLRKCIERCLSSRGPSRIGFFVSGTARACDHVKNAEMIYQMLA
jgi:hypothetical protein